MIIHNVAFQWKAGATPDHQKQAYDQLVALKDQIPTVIHAYVGTNRSPNGRGYTLCATMMFDDQNGLDAYMVHPAHQALVSWLIEWVYFIEIDIEAE